MLQIPQNVLETLRCSICESYLSSKPLMVRADNRQVCGKCYKLLPTEEKNKCVRQIGLESVAEIISFPCRYNIQGCPHRFGLSEDKEHEASCSYGSVMIFRTEASRYPNINNYDSISSEYEMRCATEQVKASLTYKINDNKYDFKNISYSLDIKGNNGQSILIKNANNQESEEVEIKMKGTLLLKKQPEPTCSDIIVKPIASHNIYESLRSGYDVKERTCISCGNSADINHCLQGHKNCNKCKTGICLQCVKLLEKEAKTICKYFERGCKETLDLDSLHRHQADCQYKDYKCILNSCNVTGTLMTIKQHIRSDHMMEIFQTNEANKKLTNKDETFVIFCYGNVFKCVYYYYKSFVEFFVTYIGSCDEAVNFYYEIIVNIKGYVISKRSKVSNWNNEMLEKGITFEKTELQGITDKKLNVEVTLRIINKN